MSRIPVDERTRLVRPTDGGSYRRLPDGSIEQIEPTTQDPPPRQPAVLASTDIRTGGPGIPVPPIGKPNPRRRKRRGTKE